MKEISIIGTLLNDAQWRTIKDNNRFLTFDVSVYNGKNQDGTYKPSDIFNCTLNENYAEKISKYLLKRSKIYLSGIPTSRAYIAKDGLPRSNISIRVNNIELLNSNDNKQDNREGYNPSNSNFGNGIDDLNTIPF